MGRDVRLLARHWCWAGSDAKRETLLEGVCFSFLGPLSQPAVT